MVHSAILCIHPEILILTPQKEYVYRQWGDRYVCELALSLDEGWEAIVTLYDQGIRTLILICHWFMPHFNGAEFLNAIHQQFPDLVTVIVDDHSNAQAIAQARHYAELFSSLHQPWHEETLTLLLRSRE